MLPKRRPPTHPGEMLKCEFLEPMGISQAEFAKDLGCSETQLNKIIVGESVISEDLALALSKALKTSSEFWFDLQSNWDLWHSKKYMD